MKVLLLVMDAGDRELLQEWMADGTLPALHLLLNRSLVGDTASVDGLYEGSTWPSFYTGVNPARHGFHRLTQIDPGTYEFVPRLPGTFIRQEPFWNRLSKTGRKVAVLDVPLAGLSGGLNGIQMVEWGSHDAAYGFQAWPPELKRDVLKRFGEHPASAACDSIGRSPRDFRRFADRLIAGVEKKRDLTLHYMQQTEWDLFVQVFTEGHCAGHQCWHLHDPAHPDYSPGVAALTGDPLREVYVAIDRAIGEILARVDTRADADTIVLFLASHGMAHNVGANFLLEEILARLGALERWPAAGATATAGRVTVRAALDPVVAIRGLWGRLPRPVRAALKPALLPLFESVGRGATGPGPRPLPARLDLARSRCFPHSNGGLVSGIRVNLRGREPMGLVEPGKEVEDFCRELTADLLDVVHMASGKPMVKRIMRTSALYQGDRVDHLPDLLVEWSDEVRVGSKAVRDDASCRIQVSSGKIGLVEGEYTYCRTGDHRPGGLFAVAGPGIQRGRLERTVSIMDFAPTLLTWFGIVPEDMDGRPIFEIWGAK
jgi:predicted AlkP superfamily phosphohydrolase/phosphomutase